ncbi:methyltransferase-like protein [Sporosarcina luteola]|nr:methyltransferase-like protein [Sporosarcina luteola]
MKKYALDRIENGYYVFVDYPAEEQSLLIEVADVKGELKEGDIVSIEEIDGSFAIELLEKETQDMKENVRTLLEKLQNKKR